MSKPIIEVKDYSYRYASTEELVLKNITFTVNEGDFVGVVGCNRAGKSTLCKSIVGILPFVSGGDWSGEIVIDGKSLNDTKGNGTTDVVGIVFQDAESQFTQQTVEDEIAFAMCNFGYERNQMRERVKFAAEACGLMGMLDRSPYHLASSSGWLWPVSWHYSPGLSFWMNLLRSLIQLDGMKYSVWWGSCTGWAKRSLWWITISRKLRIP